MDQDAVEIGDASRNLPSLVQRSYAACDGMWAQLRAARSKDTNQTLVRPPERVHRGAAEVGQPPNAIGIDVRLRLHAGERAPQPLIETLVSVEHERPRRSHGCRRERARIDEIRPGPLDDRRAGCAGDLARPILRSGVDDEDANGGRQRLQRLRERTLFVEGQDDDG